MNKLGVGILPLLFIYFMAAHSSAMGATFTVSTNADSGLGSLRQAVLDANAAATNDVIVFNPGITSINVASVISVTNNGTLDINGPGSSVLTLTGTSPSIFTSNAIFTLRGVRLTGGLAVGSNPAVQATGGTIVLEEIFVENYDSGNSSSGAVYFGGGSGHIIRYSTFATNTSAGECSAIRNDVTLTIVNTTVTGNTTTGGGGTGAICAIGGTTTIRNATIASNTSAGSGSFGGGGVFVFNNSTADLGNTIVAGNTTSGYGPDIGRFDATSTLITVGGNLIGTNDGNATAPNTITFPTGNPNVNGDKVGTNVSPINPLLGPLTNNGGTTQTRALIFGSPAIDAGIDANAAGLIYDQRVGFNRFRDGNGDTIATVDIGAYEFSLIPTAAPVSVSGRVMNGKQGISGAIVSVTGPDGEVLSAVTNPFGYYRIEGLEVGRTYLIEARAKRYIFTPQVVSLQDDVVEFNINAL